MDHGGICLACNSLEVGPVEPDARNYECDGCGAREVFGIEEAVLMGAVQIGGEKITQRRIMPAPFNR